MAEASLKLGTDWATKESSLLGYNDENDNYKPIPFDFSRASIGTRVNRDGLIEEVQDNIPRIDFSGDGSLKLEPQRTNSITYTELSSFYSTSAMTMSDNQGTSPDGGNNAFKALPTATNSQHIFFKSSMGSAANTFTQSIFAKANGYNFCFVRFDSPSKYAFFDLANGVTAYADSGITSSIEDYGNGWYRCIATMTTTSYVNAVIGVSEAGSTIDDRTFNADGINSVLFYGHQSELGSYSTSLIPTSGSAVTRVADVCDTRSDMQDFLGVDEGTWFTHLKDMYFDITGTSVGSFTLRETSGLQLEIMQDGNFFYRVDINNSTAVSDLDGEDKLAIAWSTSGLVIYVNGSNVYSTASSAYASAYSTLYLPDSTRPPRVDLKSMMFYSTRLSNAELEELTTI